MAKDLPSASLVENVRFNSLVVVPNAVQGIFRRRPAAVAAATRADVDRWAVGLLSGMRRSHGPGPVWVRVIKDPALLLLAVDDIRRVLEGSPQPFASDPEAKRKGMGSFQPDALTISRGELWANRRRFAEAVLDTGRPRHRLAGRFAEVTLEETAALIEEVEASDGCELRFDPLNRALRRITRRVVLGDSARDDEELSKLLGDLMSEANGMPSEPGERYPAFAEKVEAYVTKAEPGSLAGLAAEAPADAETKVPKQITHWLFALGDTLPANALRALALIASHPKQRVRVSDELAAASDEHGLGTVEGIAGLEYLDACLEEAMRLWPTTPMLSRETVEDVDWNGTTVPAGTQILIVNTFMHRDKDRLDFADRFAPEAWTDGDAAADWSFNQFSHGPQGCPGAGMALFIAKALITRLLSEHRLTLRSPRLDPDRPLPHMLDYFGIRLRLEPA